MEDLVHSGPQWWRGSTRNSRGGTRQGERLLKEDTVGALLQAGKKLKSPRIRIEIEVPEVHLDARLFVHGLCIRGCWESRGGKHRDLDREAGTDAIRRLKFRLLRMRVRLGLNYLPRASHGQRNLRGGDDGLNCRLPPAPKS